MQIIPRNTQTKIYLYVYVDGVLTTPDSIPTVSIHDADIIHDNTPVSTYPGYLDKPATEEEPGVYSVYINQTLTSVTRVMEAVWRYQINGEQCEQYDVYKVESAYADTSEIIDFLNLGASPADINYYAQEELITAEKMARTIVEGYTMQRFDRWYGQQEQMGIGSDAIELTEKMLILQKVYENGLLVIDNTVTPAVNNFGFPIELSPTGKAARIVNTGWDVRYDNQVDPTIMYYGRFRDQTRYTFEGQMGYRYVPEDIKIATMMLVGDIISNDFNWRNKYLKKVDLSEISFEMASGAFNGTGNVMVDNILDLYRNLNIVVI